jgi:hypothetical protein
MSDGRYNAYRLYRDFFWRLCRLGLLPSADAYRAACQAANDKVYRS